MSSYSSAIENGGTESSGARAAEIRIPAYRLLDRVGEGGMGTVYRAMQQSPDRVVAVKVLHAAGANAVSLPAFHRESRLLASLSHPHIVAIHDCGQHDGRYFLVTEFVDGSPLRAAMKPGRRWAIGRAAALLDRIAQALSYLHEHGVLHLDLKPENVLCTAAGDVKIADFGLALARMDTRALAELGLARGTIDYCAPEQRYGLQKDERSDLFSLGVLAYELLTGQLPGRIYRSAVRLNRRLPAGVDDVLRRALSRRPEQRFDSVAEFNAALQAALAQRRRITLRRIALVGLAAMALLALVLYYPWTSSADTPTPRADPADTDPPRSMPLHDNAEQPRRSDEFGESKRPRSQ